MKDIYKKVIDWAYKKDEDMGKTWTVPATIGAVFGETKGKG
jgi:hypothetical protein